MSTREHSPTPDTGTGPPAARSPHSSQVDLQHRCRWWILAVIGVAQLPTFSEIYLAALKTLHGEITSAQRPTALERT